MPTWVVLAGAAVALAALIRSVWKDRAAAIDKRARWEGAVDSDRTHFRESLDRLQVAVDRILRRLIRLNGGEGDTVAGHSKLSLTPLGRSSAPKRPDFGP